MKAFSYVILYFYYIYLFRYTLTEVLCKYSVKVQFGQTYSVGRNVSLLVDVFLNINCADES